MVIPICGPNGRRATLYNGLLRESIHLSISGVLMVDHHVFGFGVRYVILSFILFSSFPLLQVVLPLHSSSLSVLSDLSSPGPDGPTL
jgi:hypothetical protein